MGKVQILMEMDVVVRLRLLVTLIAAGWLGSTKVEVQVKTFTLA
jgi:hypothetical protein